MKLLKWIKSLFKELSYQDSVDRYVASKNPTTTSEVEYWIQRYDQQTQHKGWVV